MLPSAQRRGVYGPPTASASASNKNVAPKFPDSTDGPGLSRPPRRTRLIDVAEASGVSKAAASRILSGDASFSVAAETRSRVLSVARELGYKPHAGAQALARASSGSLALIVPDITNWAYATVVRAAFRRAEERGYVVLLAEDASGKRAESVFAELVESGRADGLIIASALEDHPLLSSSRLNLIPHVFCNREVPESGRNVRLDWGAVSEIAVDHLSELGHRNIGHISGPTTLSPARDRETGFLKRTALHNSGSAPVERAEFSIEGGAQAARRLMTAHPELTAIYTSVLTQAIGALHAVKELGIRIPADLSIISSDDSPLADFLDPPLTTVSMPLVQLGETAVDAVIDQILGNAPRDIDVPGGAKLAMRKSTAVAPARLDIQAARR